MAVTVTKNQHGYLVLRIGWKGRRTWLGLKNKYDGDRGPNTRSARRTAVVLEEELAQGRLLHEAITKLFGECPQRLLPQGAERRGEDLSVAVVAEEWFESLKIKRRRASHIEKARTYLDAVILPFWREVRLQDVTFARVEAFQTLVLARTVKKKDPKTGKIVFHPIRVKTARNVVSGHFKAFMRWARRTHRLPKEDPFDGIEWVRESSPDPDPFSPADRTIILDHFASRKPFWFRWLNTLFWTGMRQGESTALRVRDFDEKAGTLRINKSRSHGEENEPKTARSVRTIRLLPEALGPLREYMRGRLVFDPDAYLFLNPEGGPISQKEWPKKSFYPVLRKLRIRLRDFYSTRHTFITEMIRRGSNLKAVAEYCGTSVAMIERSYGNLFPKGVDGGVKSLAEGEAEAKVVTFAVTLPPREASKQVNHSMLQGNRKWSHGESNPGLRRERPPS